ncbi:hypothetical protein [Carnobacterium sp.]|uniref:hypothetical protein n=1 Tax=Carnobacterium sp. TaxID=48221 RepID=UPI00388DAF30
MSKRLEVYKGYQLLAEGTAKQCADKLGVKVETIWYYKSAAYQRKGSGENRRIAIELGNVTE